MGDLESFHAFVRTHSRALARSAWLLTGDWSSVDDLLQITLERSWQNWQRIENADDDVAYVRRVLINTFLSSRRRRWHDEVPTDEVPETVVGDEAADADVRESVRAAMTALPPGQRAVIVLRYFNDLTEAQTAEVLRCSISTVKSQSAKAFRKLRAMPSMSELFREEVTS